MPARPADAERARLFVALELPEAAREALERWRATALRDIDGLRSVPPAALHATLCFLGWRVVDEIEPIAVACAAALGQDGPPALAFDDPVWLPARRPHVLAIGLDDPSGTLARIQATLSGALSAGGWYSPEKRSFLAHVTVARVSRRARIRGVELAPVQAERFDGAAVTLYRSRLERTGARYEALRRIALG